MATETKSSGGIGYCGLLTVLLVGLKLTGYIAWSWWWVFSPLLLPWAIIMAFVLITLLVWFFVKMVIK